MGDSIQPSKRVRKQVGTTSSLSPRLFPFVCHEMVWLGQLFVSPLFPFVSRLFPQQSCLSLPVPSEHIYGFQVNTRLRLCVCVCVCVRVPGAQIYMCVCDRMYTYACSMCTHMCVFTWAHMRFARVHICVFTCTHMCVLIRHVYAFQEKSCLLSDEVCSACTCMCVHMYTYLCSTCTHLCVHACTHVRSNWTRFCVPGEHMVVIRCVCLLRVHMYVRSFVHMCAFHVPIGHVFVFRVNTCLFSDERTCVCVCVPGAHI